MQTIDVIQGTDEWLEARKLKMTASHAQQIGNMGKGLETYIYDICAEYLSTAEKEVFSNGHTERGNAYESEARSIYELESGNTVHQVGFCQLDDFAGCSPDGLIGDDGLVEIKCLSDRLYLIQITTKKIVSTYLWQMQMQLYVTGRQWCDFVAYNPNYKNPIYIQRVTPDTEKFKALEQGLIKGKKMIEHILKSVDN